MVYLVDTNILVIANDYDHEVGFECVEACIKFLLEARNHIIAIDNMDHIFSEYRKHASQSGKPNPGDAFMKWLYDNQGNPDVCLQVQIEESFEDENLKFRVIPRGRGFENFDLSNQKFLAVALSIDGQATVVNASDSDWYIHT